MHPISPEYVRQILDYNPATGMFMWKRRVLRVGFERIDKGWNKRFADTVVAARSHRHGHLQIGIHCKNYMAHRVAWAHHYGEWPAIDLDHINGDPKDNRIINLRLATASENLCNQKIRIDNTSGFKGVSWAKKEQKWQAYITKDNRTISLGRFASIEDALEARKAAESVLHGEFARSV